MRVNMPVTSVERQLKDGESVVSKTDLNGVITYINRTFCEISGYSEQELIGAPQNIVRHPDMPPAAFQNLWDTLKAGKSWKGLVKNRCKDGGFYWVEANANPIFENGKIVGYMSLRTRPSRKQIEYADRVYQKIREGKARGIKVKDGRILRSGILGLFDAVRRPSIRGRLVFIVAFLSIVCIGIGALAVGGMAGTKKGLETVYSDRLIPAGQIGEIVQRVMENRMLVMEAVARPTSDVIRANEARIARNRDEISKLWDAYLATYLTPEEKELATKWGEDRARFVKEGLSDALAALNAGKIEDARKITYGQMENLYAPVREGASRLLKLQLDVGKQEFEKAESDFSFTRNLTVIVTLAALSLAGLMGFILIRAIIRPLKEVEDISMAVSSGDLTRNIVVGSDDEVGRVLQAVKNVNGNLRGIVDDVRMGSGNISQASQEISAGNNDLSQRTQEQASALEETASSMEEMTSTVKQNADNARQANQLAVGARDQAQQGGEVVTKAVHAMNEINIASKKIADIISVIDEIAFQTNLLALNAAVEAARAGEQGRGFAVVASEVRNLAQRSAGAAKEIKDLINDSVEKVKNGSALVDASGKTLLDIVDGVKKVTDIVAEIAAASQEQSTGIDQVNKAVMQMDEVTQQNAALVEEAAAASKSMEEQAYKLVELMSFFRMGQDGVVAHATRRPAPVADAGGNETHTPTGRKKAVLVAPMARRGAKAAPAARVASPPASEGSWEEF